MARAPRVPAPFEPLLTRSLPGGSLILDQNLLAIRDAISRLTASVTQISSSTTINRNGVAGAGGMTFDFGDNEYTADDAAGAESWLTERTCPFGNVTAGLFQLSLYAQSKSSAGSGVLRIRTGGTTGQPDGSVIAMALIFGATFHLFTYGPSSTPNPGDTRLVKVTGQPSAAGQSLSLASILLRVA